MTAADSGLCPALPTVLLVDDEEDIRDLLSLLLRDLGYEPIAAADGQTGLAHYRASRPAVVLTDIKMPVMDGIGLLAAVKELDPEAEVVMMSGHADMDLAIKSLKLGAADFLTKPIDVTLLEHSLGKCVERASLKRQLADYTRNLERLVAEKTARLVDLERRLAARQIVEGLSSAMRFVASRDDGRGTLSELPCLVSIHSREGRVITANELYRERLGDPEGRDSGAAYGASYPGGAGSPVLQTIETGRPGQGRETMVDLSGREFHVLVSTTPISDGENGAAMVLEIAVDMTEVERLHAELVQSHRRYRDLFDAVPCAITVQDRALTVVEANQTFVREFGARPGVSCFSAYKHRSEPCPECPILATFEDGARHQAETVVSGADGSPRNILIWTAPLFDEAGRVEKVMEVSTDITQIRQLQDHLSSLGMMLGSMSHGVKGLLMGLDGGMYRVDSGLRRGDLDKVKSGWDTVRHRVERIRKMVLDILYYAKSRELVLGEVDAATFAEDLAMLVEGKAVANGIEFRREFSTAHGAFEADATALSSALVNFLENAVDACLCETTGRKRELAFRVALAPAPEGGRVEFEVTDSGVGMDRETREKMFTLFFSSKGSKGTGIGLFVSSQVFAQHHGGIEVDSSPGEGTSIRAWLPLRQPAAPRQGSAQGAGQAGGQGD